LSPITAIQASGSIAATTMVSGAELFAPYRSR
jgi:hypothetical protein